MLKLVLIGDHGFRGTVLYYPGCGSDFLQILSRWVNITREVIAAPNGLEALAQVMR